MRYYQEHKMNHSNTFLLSFPEAKTIIVSGDIHGDFNQLVFKLCIQYQLTDTLLIVAGDCGFGFEKKEYYEQMVRRNTKRMNQANNWIVFVRGNHDNPAYFDGVMFNFKRFIAVPNYTILQACNIVLFKNTLPHIFYSFFGMMLLYHISFRKEST